MIACRLRAGRRLSRVGAGRAGWFGVEVGGMVRCMNRGSFQCLTVAQYLGGNPFLRSDLPGLVDLGGV